MTDHLLDAAKYALGAEEGGAYASSMAGASPSMGFFWDWARIDLDALPMGVRSRTERALRHLRRWRPWWLYRDEEAGALSVVIDPDLWTDYGRRLVAKWERAWADIDLSGPWTETPAQSFRRHLAKMLQAKTWEATERAILGEGTGRPQGIILEHEDEEPWR